MHCAGPTSYLPEQTASALGTAAPATLCVVGCREAMRWFFSSNVVPLPRLCVAGCKEAIRVMRDQPSGGHIFNMDGAGGRLCCLVLAALLS